MISEAFGFGDQRQKSTVEQHIEIFGGLIIIVVFQEVYINVIYDEYFFYLYCLICLIAALGFQGNAHGRLMGADRYNR